MILCLHAFLLSSAHSTVCPDVPMYVVTWKPSVLTQRWWCLLRCLPWGGDGICQWRSKHSILLKGWLGDVMKILSRKKHISCLASFKRLMLKVSSSFPFSGRRLYFPVLLVQYFSSVQTKDKGSRISHLLLNMEAQVLWSRNLLPQSWTRYENMASWYLSTVLWISGSLGLYWCTVFTF